MTKTVSLSRKALQHQLQHSVEGDLYGVVAAVWNQVRLTRAPQFWRASRATLLPIGTSSAALVHLQQL